jgi:hypothetical protein
MININALSKRAYLLVIKICDILFSIVKKVVYSYIPGQKKPSKNYNEFPFIRENF